MKRVTLTLFFIEDLAPTDEQVKAADDFSGRVAFRNANHVRADEAPEICDFVTGAVVPPYDKYPLAITRSAKANEGADNSDEDGGEKKPAPTSFEPPKNPPGNFVPPSPPGKAK